MRHLRERVRPCFAELPVDVLYEEHFPGRKMAPMYFLWNSCRDSSTRGQIPLFSAYSF